MKLRQLLVQTDDPVSLALAAFFLVRTAAAILALKIFLGSAVFIAPYRPAVNEMEFLSVNGFSGVETDKINIFLQNFFKLFDSVFLPNIEFHAE